MKTIKNIISSTLILTLVLNAISCKTSKKKSQTNVVEEVQPTDTPIEPVKKNKGDIPEDANAQSGKPILVEDGEAEKVSFYAFTVSFFSIGEGTDGPMQTRFMEYIEKFKKDKNVELLYEKNQWGREGEVDYCFTLSELNQKNRLDFIEHAKTLLSESKLVHVAENGQCHPKRR